MSSLFTSASSVYHVPRETDETDEDYWDRAWSFVSRGGVGMSDARAEAQERRGIKYASTSSSKTSTKTSTTTTSTSTTT
nr:hypothetical protein TetV2_00360 [Oceanusvirus sp.]